MNSKKLFFLALLVITLPLIGWSCGQKKANNGGVYKSTDGGETWEQKVKIDEKNSLANLSVNQVVVDKNDSNIIFAGTDGSGIYKSSDGGETWGQTSLRMGKIQEIAFNPEDSLVLYTAGSVAGTGKMYKSSDGGDNWEEVYAETHDRTAVNCVVVDWYDPRKIYAGTNSGALLKSTDSGRSWVAMQWFDQNVKKIIVSYRDSRELYVQLDRAIHKSVNSAESFVDLQDFLEEFGKVTAIHDLVVHPQDKNIVYFISNLGLLKSSNGGQEWQDVPLLSYPGFSSVADLALDPQDSKVIYFSYDSNLYKSTDGGQNWSVKQFTSGTINSVVLNPSDTAVLYTGVLVSN